MKDFTALQQIVVNTTKLKLNELMSTWKRMFDEELCEINLLKLNDHVNSFYDDVIKESEEKEKTMRDDVKHLQEEAEELKEALKVEIDMSSFTENTPLSTQQMELDKRLTDLRGALHKRREVIYELLLQQEQLCEDLGKAPRPLEDQPMPTQEEICDFRTYIQKLHKERSQRVAELVSLRGLIKDSMKVLGLMPTSDDEERLLNERHPKLNDETMNALRDMNNMLNEQVNELKASIDNTRAEIEKLWHRLSDFSSKHKQKIRNFTEYTHETYEALKIELQRCQALRRQKLKSYIEKVRIEIVEMWNKNLTSDVERQRFTHFSCNFYTEDLLELHELELDDLKRFYEENKQIYELFNERNILWERMEALEAKANEPGRYNNRGGQLLKEERERKTITNKLPKIEQQITNLVHEFEARSNSTFKVHGESILEVMASDWERKRQAKELLSTARKQAQGPTPGRTPLSLKNASTLSTATISMRRTPTVNQHGIISSITTGSRLTKRKLNAKESTTPNAKRCLIRALNSPNSHQKPARVLASSIRRRSIKTINSANKRRSLTKTKASSNIAGVVPKITLETPSVDNIDSAVDSANSANEDTYESFLKSIEPESRSSTLPANSTKVAFSNFKGTPAKVCRPLLKRQQLVDRATATRIIEQSKRIAKTPTPHHIQGYKGTQEPHQGAGKIRAGFKKSNSVSNLAGCLSTLNSAGGKLAVTGSLQNLHAVSPRGNSKSKFTSKNSPIII